MRNTLCSIAICLVAVALAGGLTGCTQQAKEDPMQTFVTAHVAKIKPMEKAANLAEWKAENTGKGEDFDRVSVL